MSLRDDDFHIDGNWPTPDGHATGLVERDYSALPVGSVHRPMRAVNIPLIPENEWSERIKEKVANKSQLSDIRLRANGGQPIPSLNQNDGHGRWGYCFPSGTRIRLADGTQKNIEDMRMLDEVLTAEGNFGKVKQLHVREFSGELVTIKAYGHTHLRATPEHPVLTKRGYVAFGELTTDDWVCIPRYAPQRASVVMTSEHVAGVKKRIKSVHGEPTWETRLPDATDKSVNHVPDVLRLTPGVGRIFGLWLAEGFTDRSRGGVLWSFNVTETETLVSDLVSLLKSEWDLDANVRPGPGANVTLVEIRGVLWCQLFESLCGKLAGGKKLHADLAGGPKEFLEALFWGWMDGDGCDRGRRGKAYTCGATISHDLALNMYDIANAIGLTPSILHEKPQQNRYAKVRQPVWKVQVNPTPSTYRPNYRLESEDIRVWRKIYKIEKTPFTGPVYNIGVEGDNSYVAEGMSVHNCWAHSSTHAHMLVRAAQMQPYVRLSAFMVACIIKNYRDEGAWGALSTEFIEKNGQPADSFWPQLGVNPKYDTPDMRQNAALHKITGGWIDLDTPVYDRDLSRAQVATCLLNNIPVVVDYNWWGHSVCAMDLVEVTPGNFGVRIWNSWGDDWGTQGTGVLKGSQAWPNGAVAPYAVTAAAA